MTWRAQFGEDHACLAGLAERATAERLSRGWLCHPHPAARRSGAGVSILGNDPRGVLFGAGCLLRRLEMTRGQRDPCQVQLDMITAPKYALRGHQLGYRDKTNAYDAWDLPDWDQYIRELAIFGTNAIELIPPRSDDRLDSVHFPLPPLEMMEGMSRIADRLWPGCLDLVPGPG